MSNSLREQAAWRSGKVPIISKYAEEHAALMSAIAGRGFLNLPGYAYSAENRLEFATKYSLSELNFKILSETVERELKQSGIDYDMAHKTALMAWEIEKQSLMDDWAAELAGIKLDMAEKEEVLDRLAIEVSKRAITLSEAKVALELSMEAYKKTLADLDGDVAPYETQLAAAKLLTAQKKLELIPVVEQILTKEQELLTLEQSKASYYTIYMQAVKALSDKKETLTPFINELSTKVEEHATKITDVLIPLEEDIAAEKVAQSAAAVTKAGYQINELTENIATDTKRIELGGAKRDLADTKFGYDQDVLTHENSLQAAYQNLLLADFTDGLADEQATNTAILDKKTTVDTLKNSILLTSQNTTAGGQIEYNSRDTEATNYQVRNVAEAQAAAKVSAALTHLIG
jgi:hypothetical protein